MILMNYAPIPGVPPVAEWAPDEVKAHMGHMEEISEELTANGEFVDGQGLAGPDVAKIVTHDGVGAPVITDGPFPESKEFLAGYWLVDVESEERAIEIAAKTSAAPGYEGKPVGQHMQVRPVMDAPPDMEW
jgi:hypothetical protein